jgi:hypothetical protein
LPWHAFESTRTSIFWKQAAPEHVREGDSGVRLKTSAPTWVSPEIVPTKKEGRAKVSQRLGRGPEVDSAGKMYFEEFGGNRQKPPKM